MLVAAQLNRGMVMDVAVGETITIHPSKSGAPIVVSIEPKSGQRSRIRIQSQADDEVRIDTPKKTRTG